MGSRPAVDLMASSRRFPPPWFRRRNRARFIVRDYGQRFICDYNGQGLAYEDVPGAPDGDAPGRSYSS